MRGQKTPYSNLLDIFVKADEKAELINRTGSCHMVSNYSSSSTPLDAMISALICSYVFCSWKRKTKKWQNCKQTHQFELVHLQGKNIRTC